MKAPRRCRWAKQLHLTGTILGPTQPPQPDLGRHWKQQERRQQRGVKGGKGGQGHEAVLRLQQPAGLQPRERLQIQARLLLCGEKEWEGQRVPGPRAQCSQPQVGLSAPHCKPNSADLMRHFLVLSNKCGTVLISFISLQNGCEEWKWVGYTYRYREGSKGGQVR